MSKNVYFPLSLLYHIKFISEMNRKSSKMRHFQILWNQCSHFTLLQKWEIFIRDVEKNNENCEWIIKKFNVFTMLFKPMKSPQIACHVIKCGQVCWSKKHLEKSNRNKARPIDTIYSTVGKTQVCLIIHDFDILN